jgi:hypothetical protein
MLLALLAPPAAGAVAPPPPSPRAALLTILVAPSFGPGARIEVERESAPAGAPPRYRFRREILARGRPPASSVGADYASTQLCPASYPVLLRVEDVKMPAPDLFGVGREASSITLDGTLYRLETWALHPTGDAGALTIESNAGTPLAVWVDGLLATLEPCWRETPPAGTPW